MSFQDYLDKRADFWRRFFDESRDYDDYLVKPANPEVADRHEGWAAKWKNMALNVPPLTPEQVKRLQGHGRKLNMLVYSGVWCGDCVRQGPMFKAIADAIGANADLRLIDRDHHDELTDELRIVGARRVPVVVFLSEDFFELGRFGDRSLTVYRAKAARELGPACDAGLVAPPDEQMSAELGEWVDITERMLLMLRLSPFYRTKYSD